MIFKKVHIAIFIILFSFPWTSLAQSNKTSIHLEPEDKLLIIEVNFKNKKQDWLKIYYDSPMPKITNLKGLMFEDDKVLKTIEDDYYIHSGDIVTLTMKNNSIDNSETKELFTNHPGLTATTEQIILRNEQTIFDAVCWSNEKPTNQEIKDLTKLFEAKAWISKAPSQCIDSGSIQADKSILRKIKSKDTDSKDDWKTVELQSSEIKSSKNPSKSTSNLTKKKSPIDVLPNGTTSKSIVINEILPNPPKGHSNEEWIELANTSGQEVILTNWKIDDGEQGSKPWQIPQNTKIKAHGFFIIPKKLSKISLSNSSDQVRLFDGTGKLLQTVPYKEAPVGSSFARIHVKEIGSKQASEEKWEWENSPTPDKINPDYYRMVGTISGDINLSAPYSFILEDEKHTFTKIFFEENIIPAPLAKVTFIKNTKIKLEVMLMPSQNQLNGNQGEYHLKKYEILSDLKLSSPTSFSNIFILVIGIIVSGIVIKYAILRWPIQSK